MHALAAALDVEVCCLVTLVEHTGLCSMQRWPMVAAAAHLLAPVHVLPVRALQPGDALTMRMG